MKKTAVKGLIILVAVALVCVFFSGTLHSITTAKVQMTKAKTGKLTSEISISGELYWPETESVFVPGLGGDDTLVIRRMPVSAGSWVQAGQVLARALFFQRLPAGPGRGQRVVAVAHGELQLAPGGVGVQTLAQPAGHDPLHEPAGDAGDHAHHPAHGALLPICVVRGLPLVLQLPHAAAYGALFKALARHALVRVGNVAFFSARGALLRAGTRLALPIMVVPFDVGGGPADRALQFALAGDALEGVMAFVAENVAGLRSATRTHVVALSGNGLIVVLKDMTSPAFAAPDAFLAIGGVIRVFMPFVAHFAAARAGATVPLVTEQTAQLHNKTSCAINKMLYPDYSKNKPPWGVFGMLPTAV